MTTDIVIKPPGLGSPDPHYMPGYTGHCPEYLYRIGDTYGNTTHKILLSPRVTHFEKTIISERTSDDFQVYRPHERNIDVVNARCIDRQGDAIFKHPMIPGYKGFVPRISGRLGQRFSVLATEALSDMAEQQAKDKKAMLRLQKETRLQSNTYSPTTAQDRQLVQSEFKLPLLEVRPQLRGILRNLPVDEPKSLPPSPGSLTSPYFKDTLDPEKRFKTGYTGHIPYGYSRSGEGFGAYTNSSLCDFTSNYRRRKSTEWAPVNVMRPDPPLVIQPTELYHKHIGMIPKYRGYIPGAQFRFGKTFGADTRDAKRWLRGDFAT